MRPNSTGRKAVRREEPTLINGVPKGDYVLNPTEELRAGLWYRICMQWARFHIKPNIERWNHPGGLYGLLHDGVPAETIPMPDSLPEPEIQYDRDELALVAQHPELGTKVDPDAPRPGPGWERARFFRGFVDPDYPCPLPKPVPMRENPDALARAERWEAEQRRAKRGPAAAGAPELGRTAGRR